MSSSEAWREMAGRSCQRRRSVSRLAGRRHLAQRQIGIAGLGQPLDEAGLVLGLHGVGGQARPQRIAIADAVAGQAEIHAETAAEVGQQMAAADIGEEADADLGHGELGVLGQHAVRAVEGDADAAAHDDAVDQRDIGFRVARRSWH